ncbi:MAG: hypothetical protein QF767_11370, partial [Alphaproteobacteria bacterium]|nr:hypothetical protein [Alphaproteobacteria bacterium]
EMCVTYGCLLPDLPALAEFYLALRGAETAEETAPLVARLFSPARSSSCRAATPPTCSTITVRSIGAM